MRLKEKINKQYKTEIIVEVDEEEKYMLKNLASDYGYSNIEEFMVSIFSFILFSISLFSFKTK